MPMTSLMQLLSSRMAPSTDASASRFCGGISGLLRAFLTSTGRLPIIKRLKRGTGIAGGSTIGNLSKFVYLIRKCADAAASFFVERILRLKQRDGTPLKRGQIESDEQTLDEHTLFPPGDMEGSVETSLVLGCKPVDVFFNPRIGSARRLRAYVLFSFFL